jgi:hypothetical protein
MRAYYIKYCSILNWVAKEAKRQDCCRLVVELDNQTKAIGI